jgi:outer membrane receptor protein involved in Fe transport
MVVTGSGFTGALLASPTSVTSFDALELETQAVQNVGDLSAITPNLEIRRNSATQAAFFIRGVGLSDFGANATSAVAVAQDGIGLNTAPLQLGQIFDTGAVDVLRGPRSIGAYRNGSAGAISITSRKPEFDVAASLRARIGSWAPSVKGAHQGLIQDYEGMLNVPMVEDVLAARMSFRIRAAEPYKVNGCGRALPLDERVPRAASFQDPGPASQCGEKEPITFPAPVPAVGNDGLSPVPPGLPDLYGEEDNWAVRGIFLLRPPGWDDMEWLFNVHGGRLDQQPSMGQAMGTGFYSGAQTVKPLGGIINGQANLAINYIEPDQRKDFLRRCQLQPNGGCTNPDASSRLARSLARNLDERPYRGDYNVEGRTRLENWGANIAGVIPFEDTRYTSLELSTRTGYDEYERFQARDLDFTPETIFESEDNDKAHQVWQDMTLKGELTALPLDWDLGAYYFYEKLEADLFIFLPVSPLSGQDPRFRGINRVYDQKTQAFGVWLGTSWDLTEAFTISGGARYNFENKTFDFDRTQSGVTRSLNEDETWTKWTGTVAFQYAFTEDISATIKYSRGFKPGTFNAGVSGQSQTDPVEPESLDSFEGIFSASAWEGRISLNAEIFYYLYKDYQIFLFSDAPVGPPVLEIQNASDVENYGMDAEINLSPLDGLIDDRYDALRMNLRFGWLESQFIDFTNTRLFNNAAGQTIPVEVDYTGNRLPNSPRFSLSGSVDWTFELGSLGSITPRYDFSYTDDTYFDAEEGRGNVGFDGTNDLPDFTTGQRAYVLHNVRLTYRPLNANLEIAGWVRNITDQRYKTFAFDVSQFSQLVLNLVGDPRTFGMDIKLTF